MSPAADWFTRRLREKLEATARRRPRKSSA
jgi:hypothetical protein